MSALALELILALGARAQVEHVELVAQGPLEALLVEGRASADGREAQSTTRVDGPLGAGERRTLVVPIALAAPLEREGAELPLVRLIGAGAGASARVVGPAEPRPADELERLSPGLRARPWPAPPALEPDPSWSALAAVVLVLCVSLAVRRKPLLLATVALAGALAVFLLAGPQAVPPDEARVLEAELGSALCLEVRAARGELALGFDELALEPPSAALAIRCNFEGEGSARSPGALLVARRVVPAPGELRAAENAWGDLESAWVRGPAGRWSFHGPWARGAALSPERSDAGPPGWLAAGVPPGTGVLIGRLAAPAAGWVRAVGFEAP